MEIEGSLISRYLLDVVEDPQQRVKTRPHCTVIDFRMHILEKRRPTRHARVGVREDQLQLRVVYASKFDSRMGAIFLPLLGTNSAVMRFAPRDPGCSWGK